MKKLISAILVSLSSIITAQVFHFTDSSTTIIKDVTQSPAHWYLEIYNDLNVEDSLRWKAHFVNVPPQWIINFDTQSGYWGPVNDGDSADFVLLDSLSLPQKLIIGNATNLTPGHGWVLMDIYDPENPSDLIIIQYEFIITEVGAGVEDEWTKYPIVIENNTIHFNLNQVIDYSIYSSSGSIVNTGKTKEDFNMTYLNSGVYFVVIQLAHQTIVRKFIW